MPRRRRYRSLTKREVRSLSNLIAASPVIIAVCVAIYYIFTFSNRLETSVGLSSRFTSNFAIFTSLALVISTPIALIILHNKQVEKHNAEIEKKYRGMKIANIDLLTGIEFEQYLKRVLTNQGYSVSTTSVRGDLGVDLVAIGNGEKIAIQAKRHENKVSRRAISDAVAGMHHYGCNKAMVITNNYFSPGAIELAQSTGCILIDRDTLAEWINEFQVASIENSITKDSSEMESK